MHLPIDQLLRQEPNVRILPRLRRGRIDPADVVFLDFGEGTGILMAPPTGSADIAILSWRFCLAPGPFDRRGAIIDSERAAAGWVKIDPALKAAFAAQRYEEAGRLAWQRLADGLTGPAATIPHLVLARLRLLALDSKDAEIIPALPDATRTVDSYEGDAARTPVARLWPGRVPDVLWEMMRWTPVFIAGQFSTILDLLALPEASASAHRRAEVHAEAERAKAAFAAAWPAIARHDFPDGVHLERLT